MKLQKKLMIAPVVILSMQALSFGALLWVFQSYKAQSLASREEILSSLANINSIHVNLAKQHADLYKTVAIRRSLDDKKLAQLNEQRRQSLTAASASINQYTQAVSNQEIRNVTQHFSDETIKYDKSAKMAIDQSTIDANAGIAALQTADANFVDMDKTLSTIIELIKADSGNDIKKYESATVQHQFWNGLLALLLGILSVGFAWLIQRQVVHDLLISSQATRAIAAGHLDVTLESDRQDELGEMVRSLGMMVRHLHGTIELVQQTAGVIATASEEIAQDNNELKLRTERQVQSLEATVDSVKRINDTVKQNSDSAHQANRLALSASEVAVKGGVAVSQVVATMDSINESARKIVDIISVIDSIAFQTNILALNAAVEAARAGEQGKGFAVVAAEVRSLAQRSAAAAKEIKELIGNSVDKVEAGTQMVDQAGATMDEIVASVKHVTQILGEIASASQDQRTGMEQINGSIEQIDDETQKNRLLVEQTANAAVSLQGRASYLAKAIGTFKLDQRSAPRKPLEGHGKLTLPKGETFDVETVDVSTTGVGLISSKRMVKGQKCEIDFDVPVDGLNQHITASLQVAYCRENDQDGYKIGMEFIGTQGKVVDAIGRYVMGTSDENPSSAANPIQPRRLGHIQ
ncbi:MAG TPA: methyl-accepting chemotaxis protein [Burkholderiaceae bacterium]|jgi:methyl-accepting chemotaxis protein